MCATYPPTTAMIQKQKFPRVPDGRNIVESEVPKKRMIMKKGVRKPQTGHIAATIPKKITAPAAVITGIILGMSLSISRSLLSTSGPYRVRYAKSAIWNPMAISVTVRKNWFTSGFSHNYLKKFVL